MGESWVYPLYIAFRIVWTMTSTSSSIRTRTSTSTTTRSIRLGLVLVLVLRLLLGLGLGLGLCGFTGNFNYSMPENMIMCIPVFELSVSDSEVFCLSVAMQN